MQIHDIVSLIIKKKKGGIKMSREYESKRTELVQREGEYQQRKWREETRTENRKDLERLKADIRALRNIDENSKRKRK